MEFFNLFIGFLFAVFMLIGIPYMVYGNWKDTKKQLKWMFSDELLGIFYTLIGLMIVLIIFATMCAMNNSIWHIDYWITEGLWKK
jgi:hypothetical protein